MLILAGLAVGAVILRKRGLLGENGHYDSDVYEYWDKPRLQETEASLLAAENRYKQQLGQEQRWREQVIDAYRKYRPTTSYDVEMFPVKAEMNRLMGNIWQSEQAREIMRRKIQAQQQEFVKKASSVLQKANQQGLTKIAQEVQQKLERMGRVPAATVVALQGVSG